MLPLWDDVPRRRVPVMTLMLIAANLAVFLYQVILVLQGGAALKTFVAEYALVPRRLLAGYTTGDGWRPVFTSMFLHGSIAHVAGNCWYLWIFGRSVEERLGTILFCVAYVLAGIGAALLQVAIDAGSAVPMLGASGAISGLLGGYLALFPTAWVYTLVPWIVPLLPLPAFVLLIVWFATQTLNGVGTLLDGDMAQGGVAWWAHAGGFITGFCLVLWLKRQVRGVRRR